MRLVSPNRTTLLEGGQEGRCDQRSSSVRCGASHTAYAPGIAWPRVIVRTPHSPRCHTTSCLATDLAVSSDPIMPTINIGDAELHYRIDDFSDPWESAETILLHHGAGRHSGFWYPWIPLISRQYRILRFDARGHGLSSKPAPDHQWDLETLSDDVVRVLDALDLEGSTTLASRLGDLSDCWLPLITLIGSAA